MSGAIHEVITHRELLLEIAWREIRIKYKQSVMGFMWAILMPIIITSAGLVVRMVMARLTGEAITGPDVAAIALKALPWAFFVSTLRFGTNSLTSNSNLVTKIKFPRLVFPLAAALSAFVDMLVAAPLVILALPFLGVTWNIHQLWAPVLLLILVLFTAGLTVLCSAANLFFRDVRYLIEVVLTFAIFFTPVLFDSSLAGQYEPILLLNPVAPVLEALTDTVVRGQSPDLGWVGYSAAMALLVSVAGMGIFRRLEPRFAESV